MDFAKVHAELSDAIGESDSSQPIPYWLKTSLPNVNIAISGQPDRCIPGGRLITVAGPESCGKTAFMTELMAEGQRMGGFAGLEDFEHAFYHPHAKAIGLACDDDDNNWYYKRPLIAEEGFETVGNIMRHLRAAECGFKLPEQNKLKGLNTHIVEVRNRLRKIDLSTLVPIVIGMDSIASMIPEEQDRSYTDQNMKSKNMAAAQMLSIELKRLARDAGITATTVILLNQLRSNPGIMFGDNSTEPGGWAARFYASVMLRLRRVDKWYASYGDNKSEVIGDVVELYVRKNKIARPFKKTKYVFRTIDPVGLDVVGTMIMLGKEAGILGSKAGTTMEWDGKKKIPIREFEQDCYADPKLKAKLIEYVMGKVEAVFEGPVVEDEDAPATKTTSAFAIPSVAAPA